MRKAIFTCLTLMLTTMAEAQPTDFFKPYQQTALRMPAVPLIVNDPYFSIWSPYDTLTDGTTRHWTDQEKPLDGFLQVDGITYQWMGARSGQSTIARQKSVSVLATSTYYTFVCGPMELDIVFTAPMLIDDYDLLSAPVNYISYQVRATDGQPHNVELSVMVSTLLAKADANQPTRTELGSQQGIGYGRIGTIEQPILAKKGDLISIDWGYLYLPAVNGTVSIDSRQQSLCYVHAFGTTRQAASFMMLGYDEVQDMEYMFHRYQAYWTHNGTVSIFQLFRRMQAEYQQVMRRCRQLDQRIYDDALQAGGAHYAEMLSGVYRHVIAAHKLFEDQDGNLLFFSKENNSNGCVNTVDLTYPEAPLFLCYNPALQKAMMTSIFDYSYSGRWTKPFAAHDLGTYPIANGQVYGGDMPVEEAGNMLILAAELCRQDGSTSYVDKYWNIISTWADYLAENGQDPAEQLCTDDFAGHWAHNANLAVKAVMGVAAYAMMAQQKGLTAVADKYMEKARQMAHHWEEQAADGDHYRLAFDRPDTWSQKYNMVWDKLWGTHLFSDKVMQREMSYYLKQQNRYGLPLDCRKDYTKNTVVSSQWYAAWCATGIAGNTAWFNTCTTGLNTRVPSNNGGSYFADILLTMYSGLLNGLFLRPAAMP